MKKKRAIIETAARLIKSDIKTNVPSVTNEYPSIETLKLDSGLTFASIGQAMIQAVRPRRAALAPLQLGLAVRYIICIARSSL